MTERPADTETRSELPPDEEARLREAARRARADLAVGWAYRVDESFLQRLGDAAAGAGRPLTRAEVAAFVDAALARGEIEPAEPIPTPADA